MEKYYYQPNNVDKSEIDKHISIDVLKDPATFAQMATERFAHMDKNNSGGLSRVELFDSQSHSNSPIEREISRLLLKNYDSAVNLAAHKQPEAIAGWRHTSGSRDAWDDTFSEYDEITKTEISPYDLKVVEHLMMPGSLREVLDNCRNIESRQGLVQAGQGTLILAGALISMDIPPAALALGALGVGSIGSSINNYFNSNQANYNQEVFKKVSTIQSWNYFNENGTSAVTNHAHNK